MSSRWKWKGEAAGYRLRYGDVTVALVEQCAEGWFFRSPDDRVNTWTETPPRTWADPEDARQAARSWAQAEVAKRQEAGA